MTDRSVTHATFVIERTYPAASPARVFAAFADPAIKRRWFAGPDELGPDRARARLPRRRPRDQPRRPARRPGLHLRRPIQDIVPNQRIISTYEMLMDDTRISVSLADRGARASRRGHQLRYTEQGVYLDGHDTPAQREHGTRELLDALGAELQREAVLETRR